MLGLGNILTKGGALLGFPNKYSFNFDGSNDYLKILDNSGLSFADGQAFSASIWFKTSSSSEQYLFDNRSSNEGFTALVNASGTNYLGYITDGSSNATFTSTVDYNDGAWHNFAFTWDGTDTITAYIDGSSVGTGTQALGEIDGGDLYIGSQAGGSTKFFNGQLDEFAVWNTALSASDIAKIGSKPVDLTKYSASNLKLWLRAGDKVLPESDASIARSDFYTDFDGTNDYVDAGTTMGTALGDNYAGSLTTCFWFKADVTSGDDGLFNIGNFSNTEGEWSISIVGNKLRFKLNAGGWKIELNPFTSTDWNHLACVYSAGSESNSKMYLNGESVGTASGTFPSASDIDLNGLKTILGGYYSSSYPLDGAISNVSIHQTALDAQTIKQFAKSRYTPMRDNRFSVVDFDGSDDKITFTRQVFSGAFTISWWFNGDVNTDYKTIMMDSTAPNDTNIGVNDTNGQLRIYIEGSNEAILSSVPNNEWCHIVFARDGSGNIKTYLNGVAGGTSSDTGTFALDTIGRNCVMSISSVSMYNVEKSADEIYAIYQQGITYDESSLSGLVGLWRMGDDTSKAFPTIADSSSNSNDGTMTSMASDDIVQQMVAGYDMGAFESTGEELGGEKVDNNTSSAYGGGSESNIANVTNGVAITYAGTGTGLNATFSDASLLNTDIVASENKLHKLTFNAYYQGGSAGSKIRIYDQAVNHVTPSLTTTSASYSLYFRGRHASMIFQQVDMGSGNVVYITDMSFKEVLQSADLSDTYPAIIDVTEPVLGVELVDANTSSGWSAYGSNTVANVTNGVKITHVNNAGGAQGNFTDAGLLNADQTSGKTYKVKFNAYYTGGTAPNIKIWTGALNQGTQALTTSEKEYIIYFKNAGASSLYFDSVNGSQEIYILNLSTKEVSGNVGTMTQMLSSNLVYSSVLPDQSFLAGANSSYGFGSFDGTNDIVTASAVNTDYKSFSVWVKPTSTITKSSGGEPIGSFFTGGFGVIWIGEFSSADTDELITLYDGTRTTWENAGSASFPNDSWTHLALVWDGSKYQIYYNGQPQTTTTNATHVPLKDNQSIFIGRGGASRSEFFDGDISGVALWNKSLSASEVSAIYTAGRHTNLLDSYSDNLITYLAFGNSDATSGVEDTSSTIYDRSGNSNHGTVSGTTLQSPPNAEPNGYSKGDTNRSNNTP